MNYYKLWLSDKQIPYDPIGLDEDGKRTKRGLYRSKDGRLINADINGSYNIMRKGLKKVSLDDKIVSYPECRGFVYNPDKFNLK